MFSDKKRTCGSTLWNHKQKLLKYVLDRNYPIFGFFCLKNVQACRCNLTKNYASVIGLGIDFTRRLCVNSVWLDANSIALFLHGNDLVWGNKQDKETFDGKKGLKVQFPFIVLFSKWFRDSLWLRLLGDKMGQLLRLDVDDMASE